MKKTLSLLLALVMLFGLFAGCGKEPAVPKQPSASTGDTTTQTPEMPAAPETPEVSETPAEPEPEPEPVREAVTLAMTEAQDKVKTYGRSFYTEEGLRCDWAASGIEFTVDCEGDIKANYDATIPGYFQIYVDGEATSRPEIKEKKDVVLTVAEGLPAGEHTIRMVREYDIDTAGGVFLLKSLEYTGFADTLRPAEDKDLYIEFIGDSITSGLGCLDGRQYTTRFDSVHSATHAYSYLTAQALDADWSMVSRGGIGIFKGTTVGNKTVFDMYPSYNCWYPNAPEYTFERKADIVVMALATNDHSSVNTGAEFRAGFKQLMDLIREKHGQDVQIVCVWGMMTTTWGNQLTIAAEECGVHCIRVTQNNNGGSYKAGGTGHPHADGHAIVAQELTTYIQEKVLPQLKK